MDRHALESFIELLRAELLLTDRAIGLLERLARDRPKRGRPRKFLSPLAREISRAKKQRP